MSVKLLRESDGNEYTFHNTVDNLRNLLSAISKEYRFIKKAVDERVQIEDLSSDSIEFIDTSLQRAELELDAIVNTIRKSK